MPFKYLLALLCPGVANLFQEEARQFSASGSENLGMAVLVRKQFCVFPFSTTSCSSPSLKCDCMYGSLSPSESMCLFVVLLLGFEARQAGGTIHPIVPFQQHLTAPKGEREREPVWSREWRMGGRGTERWTQAYGPLLHLPPVQRGRSAREAKGQDSGTLEDNR